MRRFLPLAIALAVAAVACAVGSLIAIRAGAATPSTVYAAPGDSLQRAVDRLPDGGTLLLAGGRYARQRIVLTDRHGVTVAAEPGALPVLDAAGLTPPDDDAGVVQIEDGSEVTVRGLEITGYRTSSPDATPVGILVTGSATRVAIAGNHVHHLGTSAGGDGGNAHGIAVYGTDPAAPVAGLAISGNEVDHLTLGSSEAVVVNGNVAGWSITGNRVHDTDNIGIDAIGYESTIRGPARWTMANRARDGLIAGNTVTNVTSDGNPAYEDDCTCAGGVYVDGGADIRIEGNTVAAADIGIEIGAENPRGRTDRVRVTGNLVTGSRPAALAIGGYDPDRGSVYDITIEGNTLRGEILLQYHLHRVTIDGKAVDR